MGDKRRKSPEEWMAEIDADREEDGEEQQREYDAEFEPINDEMQADLAELFDLLHEHGYMTTGPVQFSGISPHEPAQVTLTMFLPSQYDTPR